MKAVRFHKTGGPEVLVYEDVPDPTPRDWEVMIRVEAAGVNFSDTMRRGGLDYPEPSPPPFILGIEVAGTVVAIGKAVTSVAVGAQVFVAPGAGGYAQYICVPAARVIPLPPGVSSAQAAALVAHGLTAAISLRNAARLAPGETVLVDAAAGGVGSFAVQLAKLYGASKVIAAASSPEKRAAAERLGADASVDYTQPGWAEKVRELTGGRGVDVVIEMAGGETLNQAIDTLALFGRLIVVGQASGQTAQIAPWDLSYMNRTVTGFYISKYFAFPDLIQSTLREIIGFVVSGKLSVHVGQMLPLSQAAEAHRLMEGRKTLGKVVLQPWADA
ncbi:MAG TPA: NADPH:quinone oxidoreductase family protein [Parvibaculum sp.]